MFGKGFFGRKIFDEFDDLETLSRRQPQKRAEQPQAFDSTACGRAELKVQFSREIEVFHLAPINFAPMTSIGLRGPTARSRSRTKHHSRTPYETGRPIAGRHGDDKISAKAPRRVSTLYCISGRTGARPSRLQLCQGTTPWASPTTGVAMLRLHRATAIPDNRNMERRHPPASRSSSNHARGPDRCQQRFVLFPM